MTSLPPPYLPEEQLRQVHDDLRRNQSRRKWLWFFLAASVALNFGFFGFLRLRQKMETVEGGSIFAERYLSGEKDSHNKIAVIRLEGIISAQVSSHVGYDGMVGDIREQFRLALEDDAVKAIVLRIDSPGGEVLASDQIYRTVRGARLRKKVVCSMGSVAASGGYYAAVGANHIIADDLTITGSIGVIMQTLNYKDLFGKIGLKSLVFKSGKFKDVLNGSREPTQEEMDLVQNLIMETYEQFLQVVARERMLDAQELRDGLADGRILSGKQALAVKLVDQTGTFEDAVRKAKEYARISDARVSDYVVPFSLGSLLGILTQNNAPRIEVDLAPQPLKLQQGKLYYLSLHLF
ncbi:MAG: signal peptide peptidase SppA [Verrucomicrobia bacterium]|nr:signal peptide peptidase SppA [Verrucomicrobiota bacterium]